MTTNRRNQHAQTMAPGEPEAPVSGPQPGPAPGKVSPEPPVPEAARRHPEAAKQPHPGAAKQPHPGAAKQPHPGAAKRPHPEAAEAPKQAAADGSVADSAGAPGSEDDAAGEHRAAVADELEQLAAKAAKADEYLELAQRTKADFENYRKRAIRDAAIAQERGVAKLAKELLPAVDNLDRALAAAQDGAAGDGQDVDATLVSGIKLVHAEVIAALARVGIEPYSPEGEQFDPQRHEAVAQQPFEGATPGTIVEVYQRGYRLGDSMLRPARVVVAG